jgi:tetratricopeptide (TPR) repeat protein
MPEGLEMTAKLMVPNELSAATCTARYAYAERTDCPAGIEPSDTVEFEIELVSFDREGHWQAMEIDEKIALANKMKAKGNQLYKDGKVGFAKQRYDRLIRLLDNTRDIDTEQQLQEVEGLRLATVGNLALCCTQLRQHAEAVSWCTKGLELDENSAKLLFRRGKAKTLKGDYEEAEQDLARAKEMDASIAADVDSALALNAQRRKQAAQKQKSQFKNFFAR